MSTGSNVGIFGTATRSTTLLTIHMLGETHANEIATLLGRSVSRIQASVDSLERAGLVVGVLEGTARRVRLNPTFPAVEELRSLLNRLAMFDIELQQRLAKKRRRPRRSGKAL